MENKEQKKLTSKSKWAKLRSLFKQKKVKISNPQEHIFSLEKFMKKSTSEGISNYELNNFPITLKIKAPNTHLSLKEVADARNDNIDSTGYLIWPSEELITILMLTILSKNTEKKFENFPLNFEENENLKILEIGAGYSGLAGIALKKFLEGKIENFISITDGNKDCAKKIEENLKLNFEELTSVVGESFNWKDYENFDEERGKFDLIFGADVLFFRNYHEELILTLMNLLKDETSRAVLMAPNRDSTLEQFLEKVGGRFDVEVFGLEDVEIFSGLMKDARLKEEFDEGRHGLKVLVCKQINEG